MKEGSEIKSPFRRVELVAKERDEAFEVFFFNNRFYIGEDCCVYIVNCRDKIKISQ